MLRLRIVLCLFAALFAAAALNAQVAGRLSGRVVDQTGASIPGATVNIFVPGGKEPVLSGTTNEAGLFSFIAIRPHTCGIPAASQGIAKVLLPHLPVPPLPHPA